MKRPRFHSSAWTMALMLVMSPFASATVCSPPSDNDWNAWLKQQESAGGHALKCHAAKTTKALIHRMEAYGGDSVDACSNGGTSASTWVGDGKDLSALIAAAKSAVKRLPEGLLEQPVQNYVVEGDSESTIGRVVQHAGVDDGRRNHVCPKDKGYDCYDVRRWKAVFKIGDHSCYLLTAYPVR